MNTMVGKVGVIVSIILFCIAVGVYSFVQLSVADKGKNVDLLSFVPADCMAVLETDNADFLVNEFPQTAYAMQLDTIQKSGLFPLVFDNLFASSDSTVHRLSNGIERMMVSFHYPVSVRNVVMYFQTHESGRAFLQKVMRKKELEFVPKKDVYRGEDIDIYALDNGEFVSAYCGKGFCVVSYQKNLIEQVIDAEKDELSLSGDAVFMEGYESKAANFMTLYGRTASLPMLVKGHMHCWSSFDIHLNSEVLYLSGSMMFPDSCRNQVVADLGRIESVSEKGVLALSGQQKVDSCISEIAALPQHTFFEECVSNMSRDASFIFVADMDEIEDSIVRYQPYLPKFVARHADLFRSFIFSAQLTRIDNRFSHIFVFTYKN
ncbi:hypothetical protein [Phocaeicola salanitronis]|uniref:hypothetical protein n=1 Tax=Phocaeicola salanitronis TaxID=376805 RepID=UPI0025A388E4|nr:hypothetical protein [Phocaeicola salanitronis]MDM8307558.1 hypothetical protein [Phocaeicola salanitronis]